MKKLCLLLAATVLGFSAQAVDLVESFADGKYLPKTWAPVKAMNFVDSETGNFKSALELNADVSGVTGYIKPVISANEDMTFAFDIMRVDNDAAVTILMTSTVKGGARLFGLVIAGNGGVLVSGPDGKYIYIRRQLMTGKRYRLEFNYSAFAKNLILKIDGQKAYEVPMENKFDQSMLIFSPKKGKTLIDDIELHSFPSEVSGKENVLSKVEAEVKSNGEKKNDVRLTDDNLKDTVNVPVGGVLTFNLPKREQVFSVQVYGGNPGTVKYASGDASPRSFTVHGYTNGTWLPLGEVKDLPHAFDNVDDLPAEKSFVRIDFKPIIIDGLRITFTDTNDTGKRLSNPTAVLPKEKRVVTVREVRLFSSKDAANADEERLEAEYRLPVYQTQEKAQLTFVVPEKFAGESADISIASPEGKEIYKTTVKLKAGRQDFYIPISSFPEGRLMTTINAGKAGIRKRLLRIQHPMKEDLPVEPLNMAKRKLFFLPDNHEIASYSGIQPQVFPAKPYPIYTTEPSSVWSVGSIYRAGNGQFAVKVTNRPMSSLLRGTPTIINLVADNITGPWKVVDKLPEGRTPGITFPTGHPRIMPMPPAGSKYRWYDPEKDGKIPLNRTGLVFNGYMSDADRDYGCVISPPRCRWPAATTESGENLLMSKQPVIYDKFHYDEDEFDDGYRTNDNAFGSWLSLKGDKIFYANGQTLKRSAPYAIGYDNLPTCFRILSVWESSDGSNWKFSRYMALPDENDSEGQQHYGGSLQPVVYGNFYMAYIIAYDSLTQQNYLELAYARNGEDFQRFPGNKPFCRSNDPMSWHFGYMNPPQNGNYLVGNNIYSFVNFIGSTPHFIAEITPQFDDLSKVGGALVRRRFAGRGLDERWPYFQSLGGWEGVAEMTKRHTNSCAVLESRMDGWFGLDAGNSIASVETRRFTAPGSAMLANANIGKDGFVKFQLISADGNVIDSKELTSGDALELPVFDKLPDGDFKLKITLKNAKLYTVIFK